MQDILLNDNWDVLLSNGDLIMGESTLQHQRLLLATTKADWRENPLIGIGAAAYLKDEQPGELLSEIKKEFEKDNMLVTKVNLVDDNIIINANYQDE
jgi:hypothetical protein